MTRLSSVGFLRATASLPVVAPFAVVGVELLVPSTTAHLPRWLRDSVELAVASVLYFGVPYVLFIACFLALLRRRSLRAHIWAALVSPLLMASVVVPAFLWSVGITDNALKTAWPDYARLALSIGYGYVGIALGLLLLGRRLGWFRDAEVA